MSAVQHDRFAQRPDVAELDWRLHFEALIHRYSDFGICTDVSEMTESEAWGLYRYLGRLAASEE